MAETPAYRSTDFAAELAGVLERLGLEDVAVAGHSTTGGEHQSAWPASRCSSSRKYPGTRIWTLTPGSSAGSPCGAEARHVEGHTNLVWRGLRGPAACRRSPPVFIPDVPDNFAEYQRDFMIQFDSI